MRPSIVITVLSLSMAIPALAPGQSGGQQSLAATIKVYVFPRAGQDAAQQSRDEAVCYDWATQQTGVDPFRASSHRPCR